MRDVGNFIGGTKCLLFLLDIIFISFTAFRRRKIMLGFLSSKIKQSTTSHSIITTVESNMKIDTSAIGKILVIGETGCGECVFLFTFLLSQSAALF